MVFLDQQASKSVFLEYVLHIPVKVSTPEGV